MASKDYNCLNGLYENLEMARIDAFLIPPAQFMERYKVSRREWRNFRRETINNFELTSEYLLIHSDKIPKRIKPFLPCLELIMETYRDDLEPMLKEVNK